MGAAVSVSRVASLAGLSFDNSSSSAAATRRKSSAAFTHAHALTRLGLTAHFLLDDCLSLFLPAAEPSTVVEGEEGAVEDDAAAMRERAREALLDLSLHELYERHIKPFTAQSGLSLCAQLHSSQHTQIQQQREAVRDAQVCVCVSRESSVRETWAALRRRFSAEKDKETSLWLEIFSEREVHTTRTQTQDDPNLAESERDFYTIVVKNAIAAMGRTVCLLALPLAKTPSDTPLDAPAALTIEKEKPTLTLPNTTTTTELTPTQKLLSESLTFHNARCLWALYCTAETRTPCELLLTEREEATLRREIAHNAEHAVSLLLTHKHPFVPSHTNVESDMDRERVSVLAVVQNSVGVSVYHTAVCDLVRDCVIDLVTEWIEKEAHSVPHSPHHTTPLEFSSRDLVTPLHNLNADSLSTHPIPATQTTQPADPTQIVTPSSLSAHIIPHSYSSQPFSHSHSQSYSHSHAHFPTHTHGGSNGWPQLRLKIALSQLLLLRGRAQAAESAMRDSLQTLHSLDEVERERETASVEGLAPLRMLSRLLETRDCLDDAYTLLHECVRKTKELHGESAEETLSLTTDLAHIERERGHNDSAEALLLSVWHTRQRKLGEAHARTLAAQNELALLYESVRQYDKAEQLYRDVLQKRLNNAASRGNNTTDVSRSGSETTSSQHHHTTTAKSPTQTASKVSSPSNRLYSALARPQSRSSSPSHHHSSLNKGKSASDSGSQRPHTGATAITLPEGDADEETLRAMNNLASALVGRQHFLEAEQLFLVCLTQQLRLLGSDHPETLTAMNNLGVVYKEMSSYGKAEEMCVKCLQGRRRVLGEGHPLTLQSLANLASLVEKQGREQEAEAMYTECLTLRIDYLGAHHPDTERTRVVLARLKRKHGETSD